MKNHPRNEPLPVLTFRLGEQPYAVGIEDVVEVASMVELTTLPDSPPFMMGYANRHGMMLPVFDLRQIFEQEAASVDSYTLFIVAAHEGQMAGLVVDEVRQVEYMDIGERQATAGKYIRDIVSHKGHLVQLISLPHLLGEVLVEDR
jgi:purine-binding chemotaxis protein CheW